MGGKFNYINAVEPNRCRGLINAPCACVKNRIQGQELPIMYTMPYVFNLFGTLVINLIKHKVLNFGQSTPQGEWLIWFDGRCFNGDVQVSEALESAACMESMVLKSSPTWDQSLGTPKMFVSLEDIYWEPLEKWWKMSRETFRIKGTTKWRIKKSQMEGGYVKNSGWNFLYFQCFGGKLVTCSFTTYCLMQHFTPVWPMTA